MQLVFEIFNLKISIFVKKIVRLSGKRLFASPKYIGLTQIQVKQKASTRCK